MKQVTKDLRVCKNKDFIYIYYYGFGGVETTIVEPREVDKLIKALQEAKEKMEE